MRSVRSIHDLETVRNQRTRRHSLLHGVVDTGNVPGALSIINDGELVYDGGPYRDGRSRDNHSSRHVHIRSTWRRTDQKVVDTGSPRSDGLHIRSRPRPALRRPKAFFLSSRDTKKDDVYTGAWRTYNTKSDMYLAGNRSLASDASLQMQLRSKLAKHTHVARRHWKNGGSLF